MGDLRPPLNKLVSEIVQHITQLLDCFIFNADADAFHYIFSNALLHFFHFAAVVDFFCHTVMGIHQV